MVININLAKAVEIKKNYLREKRAVHFQKLDRDFQIAFATGNKAALLEIENKRSRLRDITQHPTLDLFKDLEELKNFVPDIFKELDS